MQRLPSIVFGAHSKEESQKGAIFSLILVLASDRAGAQE